MTVFFHFGARWPFFDVFFCRGGDGAFHKELLPDDFVYRRLLFAGNILGTEGFFSPSLLEVSFSFMFSLPAGGSPSFFFFPLYRC